MNTFPAALFFIKLNRTALHVNMPGGCALSAHGAGKLIVKTDGQTKFEKDTYAKLCGSLVELTENFRKLSAVLKFA
jgi:hypothetical protein